MRRPGFTLLALLLLALGMGAALAVAEVADSVLLAPLPFGAPDRLVNAWQADDKGVRMTVTGADFLEWQAAASGPGAPFERLAAVSARGFNLTGADRPERIDGAIVSADFFALLGVQPLLGRALSTGPRAAVISEQLWRSRFGAEHAAVGRTISLDGEPVEIVGVLPAASRYPPGAELWVSARMRAPEHPTYPIQPDTDRQRHYLTVLGRLSPNTSAAQAEAALKVIQARLGHDHPDEEKDVPGALVVPLREQLYGKLQPVLLALLGVAALLFAVGWANAAHLFLARALERQHETAVRVALGATRARLWRLFFGEALAISVSAALLALLLASWAAPALTAQSPQALPPPALTLRIAALALLLGLASGASLGLFAALQPLKPAQALQEGGRTGTGGRKSARLRAAFLVLEVAVSLVLLLGAGLLWESFRAVAAVDPGFQTAGVVAADLPLPKARYGKPTDQVRFAAELLRKLRAEPQVQEAGVVSRLPLSASNTVGELALPGRESEAFPCDLRLASDGYFEALRIPLREGRTFAPADLLPGAPPVAVLNERAARRAQVHPGQRVLIWGEKEPATVVGIVGDVRHTGLDAETRPEAWRTLGAVGWPNLALVVRGRAAPAALLPTVREAVWSLDRELPIVRLEPMEARVEASLSLRRFVLELVGAAALLSLLLAAGGIFGVTSYLVAQRTRELGVRLALGATPGRLVRELTSQSLRLVLLGCALGGAAAAVLAVSLRSVLPGVSPLDVTTLGAGAALLTATAALATALAAVRATSVEPSEALRAS